MSRKYVVPDRQQLLLLPPDLRDWIGPDHSARFFADIVERLDLREFYDFYELDKKSLQGRPPYDPKMMLALILYCMSQKQYSSRSMEKMTHEDIGARFIATDHHPDHDSFAAFRARHSKHMKGVFSNVLLLCHQAGLIDLLHVAVDSTVILANASKTKNIDLDKVEQLLEDCQGKAQELLEKLESADRTEHDTLKKKYKDQKKREKALQDALDFLNARREQEKERTRENQSRRDAVRQECLASRTLLGVALKRIREEKGLTLRSLANLCNIGFQRLSAIENGRGVMDGDQRCRLLQALQADDSTLPVLNETLSWEKLEKCAYGKHYNPSDSESYLIARRNGVIRQGYLGQVATDSKTQIIVAAEVSTKNDDHPSLPSLINQVICNLGNSPVKVSADTGYASEINLADPDLRKLDLYVKTQTVKGEVQNPMPSTSAMREKLNTVEGKSIYKDRAKIVEPVFGQIKHDRGFTRFLRKGYLKAVGDWMQVCTVHNLLKLWKSGLF